MTTLYRPVPIESAEQAEALPEGTIASRDYYDEENGYHHYDCAVKAEGGGWIQVGIMDDFSDGLVIGWTALVPIEAEEAHSEDYGSYHLMEGIDGPKPFTAYLVDQEDA